MIPVTARSARTADRLVLIDWSPRWCRRSSVVSPPPVAPAGAVVGRATAPAVAPVGGRSPRGCYTRSPCVSPRWSVQDNSLLRGGRRARRCRRVGVPLGVARRLEDQPLGWARCRRRSWSRQGGADSGLVTGCPWWARMAEAIPSANNSADRQPDRGELIGEGCSGSGGKCRFIPSMHRREGVREGRVCVSGMEDPISVEHCEEDSARPPPPTTSDDRRERRQPLALETPEFDDQCRYVLGKWCVADTAPTAPTRKPKKQDQE